MAYAMEFREVVAKAYDECGSSIEVAEQFNCKRVVGAAADSAAARDGFAGPASDAAAQQ